MNNTDLQQDLDNKLQLPSTEASADTPVNTPSKKEIRVPLEEPQEDNTTFTAGSPLLNEEEEDTVASPGALLAKRPQRRSEIRVANEAAKQAVDASQAAFKQKMEEYEDYEVLPISFQKNWKPDPNKSDFENIDAWIENQYKKDLASSRAASIQLYQQLPGSKLAEAFTSYKEKEKLAGGVYTLKTRNLDGTFDCTITVVDGDTIAIVGKPARLTPQGIVFDAPDMPNTPNKGFEKKAIADRIGIAEHQVTDELVTAYHDWVAYITLRSFEAGKRYVEQFRFLNADKYKQYLDANRGKEIHVKVRKITDAFGNTEDLYGRPFAQVLSADGKYNISDSLALDPQLNLKYDLTTKPMYFYANAYMKGIFKTPKQPIIREYTLPEKFKVGANSLIDSWVHLTQNWEAIYKRFQGDTEAYTNFLRYRQLHPSENYISLPQSGQLYRQMEMQKWIDKGNKGGLWNSIGAWLGSFYDAPLTSLLESMGEVSTLLVGGYLAKGVSALAKLGTVGSTIVNLGGIAAGAGLEETINAEVDYLAKNGKPMDNSLFLGALLLNSGVLGVELKGLMDMGAGFRRLIGIPGSISKTAIDTTLLAPLKKELKGFGLAIVNEGVTEPLQNATFAAWNELDSISDIAKYPKAWLGQFQGTNRGQRIYESGSAAGASFLQSGVATAASIGATGRQIATELNNGKLFDRNADGTKLDDGDIKLSNEKAKGYRELLRQKRQKLAEFQDPNNVGKPEYDEQHFQDALADYEATVDTITMDLNKNASQFTESDVLDVQEMQNRARAHIISLAVEHAKETGQDIQQVCEDLYNAFVTRMPKGTAIPAGVDVQREILKLAAQNVFFSTPKSNIQRKIHDLKKRKKNASSQQEETDIQNEIDRLTEELNNAPEQYEIPLNDGSGTTITVDGEQLAQFEKIFTRWKELGLIPEDLTVEDYLTADFKLCNFDIDLISHGKFGNSAGEYLIRIQMYIKNYSLSLAQVKYVLQEFNKNLPDDQKLTFEDLIKCFSKPVTMPEDTNDTFNWNKATKEEKKAEIERRSKARQEAQTKADEAAEQQRQMLLQKYANVSTSNPNVNIQTLLDSYQEALGEYQTLQREMRKFRVFLGKRMNKFTGFTAEILKTFQNGNTNGTAAYTYTIIDESGNPKKITLYFHGSTLLYADLDNSEIQTENGKMKHPDQLILNRLFTENRELLAVYQQVVDCLAQNDVFPAEDVAAEQSFVNEVNAENEATWADLHTLQEEAKKGSKKHQNDQAMSKCRSIIEPLLRAAIIAGAKNAANAQEAIKFQGLLNDLNNGNWMQAAQILFEANLHSQYDATSTKFSFRALYQLLTADQREIVKNALQEAFNTLEPMTQKSQPTDSRFANCDDNFIQNALITQPYADKSTNLVYNLLLQTQVVDEAIEKRKEQEQQQQQQQQNPSDNTNTPETDTDTTEASEETILSPDSPEGITSDEDVAEATQSPETQYLNMRNALIQNGRFFEATLFDQAKDAIINELAQNPLTDEDYLSNAEYYAEEVAAPGYFSEVMQGSEAQDLLTVNYNVPEKTGDKIIDRAIGAIENDPNADIVLKQVAYWARRVTLNGEDKATMQRVGFAYVALLNLLTSTHPNIANNVAFKTLQKAFKRELKSYQKTKKITKYYKEHGVRKRVEFDYNKNAGKIATFNEQEGCFKIDGQDAYFYGQKPNTSYENAKVGECLTPTITYKGEDYTSPIQVFTAAEFTQEEPTSNTDTDTANVVTQEEQAKTQETKQEPKQEVTKKKTTASIAELTQVADYLEALCRETSESGFDLSYSAGFLKRKFHQAKEERKADIREVVTRIQEMLAKLQDNINNNRGTSESIARAQTAIDAAKAGYFVIDGKMIPIPAIEGEVPHQNDVLSFEQIVGKKTKKKNEEGLNSRYFIRLYTGHSSDPEQPLATELQPGQDYKVVRVTAVPVKDCYADINWNDKAVQDVQDENYATVVNKANVAFNRKGIARGELILVPCDADGTAIVPTLRAGADIDWNSRIRNSSHMNALHTPSIFQIGEMPKNAGKGTLTESDIEFLNDHLTLSETDFAFSSNGIVSDEQKLLAYIQKLGQICNYYSDTNKGNLDIASKLNSLIHKVNNYTGIDPVLGRLLLFLHDYSYKLEHTDSTKYGMYFLGHNRHQKAFANGLIDVLARLGSTLQYRNSTEISRNGSVVSYNLAEMVYNSTLGEEYSHAEYSGLGYRGDISWFVTNKLLRDFLVWNAKSKTVNIMDNSEYASELRKWNINPEEAYDESETNEYEIDTTTDSSLSPEDKTAIIGKRGEELATTIVKKVLKYEDVEQNQEVKNEEGKKIGEIDVIARKMAQDEVGTYHFIEVRTRTSGTGFTANNALDTRKLLAMQKAAVTMAQKLGINPDTVSIDAITIEANKERKHQRIFYTENIIPTTSYVQETVAVDTQATLTDTSDKTVHNVSNSFFPGMRSQYDNRVEANPEWIGKNSDIPGMTDLKILTPKGRKVWKSGCYAGIGSTGKGESEVEITDEAKVTMTKISGWLEKQGMVLRSGGAMGSDTAFENGVIVGTNKEITYAEDIADDNYGNASQAELITINTHPDMYGCDTEYGRQLLYRDAYQVLGTKLDTPVDFIVCYAKPNRDGIPQGGTGQAVRIAKLLNIPVFNIYNAKELTAFKGFIVGYLATKGNQEAIHTPGVKRLEVSSKDTTGIGKRLSAINLYFTVGERVVSVESAYQASKDMVTSIHEPSEGALEATKLIRAKLLAVNGFTAKKVMKLLLMKINPTSEDGAEALKLLGLPNSPDNMTAALHVKLIGSFSLNGVKLPNEEERPWAYATLYFQGIKEALAKNPSFKNILLQAFEYDVFKDTFRGHSIACQADMVAFLKYYYSKYGDQVFELLNGFDYHTAQGNKLLTNFKKWYNKHVSSTFLSDADAIYAKHSSTVKEDYTIIRQKIHDLEAENTRITPDNLEGTLDEIFQLFYAKDSRLDPSIIPEIISSPLMNRENAEDIHGIGWSSFIGSLMGYFKPVKTQAIYQLLRDGLYNDYSYVLNHTTEPATLAESFYLVREGFEDLNRVAAAFRGTSDFTVQPFVCKDCLVLADSDRFLTVITTSGKVSATGLLQALCFASGEIIAKTGIPESYSRSLRVINQMSNDNALDINEFELTPEIATKLKNAFDSIENTGYDKFIATVLDALGLQQQYNVVLNKQIQQEKQAVEERRIKNNQKQESVVKRVKKVVAYMSNLQQQDLTTKPIAEMLEDIDYLSKNLHYISNGVTRNSCTIMLNNLYRAIQQREIPEVTIYKEKFEKPLEAILNDTRAASDGIGTVKDENKLVVSQNVQAALEHTGAIGIDNPITPYNEEENSYTGVANVEVGIQYEHLSTALKQADFTDEEKKALDPEAFLARSITDIINLHGSNFKDVLSKTEQEQMLTTTKKALFDFLNNKVYSTDMQAVAEKNGISNFYALNVLPNKDKFRCILEFFQADPALALLYDIYVNEYGKVKVELNENMLVVLYTEALRQLCNFNNLTSTKEDSDFARILNMSEENFKHDRRADIIKDLLKSKGLPVGQAVFQLGRKVMDTLNLKIAHRPNAKKALSEQVAQSLGNYVLSIMQQINNSQLEGHGFYDTKEQIEEMQNVVKHLKTNKKTLAILTPSYYTKEDYNNYLGYYNSINIETTPFANIAWNLLSNKDILLKLCKQDVEHAKNVDVTKEYKEEAIRREQSLKDWYKAHPIGKVLNHVKYSLLSTSDIEDLVEKKWDEEDNTLSDNGRNAINKVQVGQYVNVVSYKEDEANDLRETEQKLSEKFPDNSVVGGLSLTPITHTASTVASTTHTLISDVQKGALKTLQTTPNHIDAEALMIYQKYAPAIFKLEGGKYEGDETNLTAKERLSDKNKSLSRGFAILDTLYNLIGTAAYYVQYVVSKTMRFQCKGSLNPQGNKQHRWLTYAGEGRDFYLIGEQEDLTKQAKFEAWALAQAFDRVGRSNEIQECYDTLMDLCTHPEFLEEFERDVCTMSEKAFEKKWNLGMEDRFQCIAAVAHLKRRAKAMQTKQPVFKTTLRAEIDSTTSGYFIKLMTILDANLLKKFGAKVGIETSLNKILTVIETGNIIDNYDTMEEIKKAINDIYRTVGQEMSKNDKKAIKETWENIKKLPAYFMIDKFFPTKEDYDAFINAMPAATQNDQGDWIVSSDLRQLLKGVVMIFGYSAGENTLEHRLSEAFGDKYETMLNDEMRKFIKAVGNKKLTAKDFEDFYSNTLSNDPMLRQYMKLLCTNIQIYCQNTEPVYLNHGRDVQLGNYIKRYLSTTLEGVSPEVQQFATCYAYYKLQVKGMVDSRGEQVDFLPNKMLQHEEALVSEKDGTIYGTITSTFMDYINTIFDESIGRAVLTGMKAFSPISFANMVMATISSILNADAQYEFERRLKAAVHTKSRRIHEPGKTLDDLNPKSNEYANAFLEAYNEMTNQEYADAFKDKVFYASMDNIFSMMQQYYTDLNTEAEDTPEYVKKYGLSVADIKYTSIFKKGNSTVNKNYMLQKYPNSYKSTSNGQYLSNSITTRPFIVRKPSLIDIGLELTAGTTQGFDAGLLTQMIVGLYKYNVVGTFIHDAMVLPFDQISLGNWLYSMFASMDASKYNWMLNYISKGLKILHKKYPEIVEAVVIDGEVPKGKDKNMYLNDNLLSTLASSNLHNVFGVQSKKQQQEKTPNNPNPEKYYDYMSNFATVGNFVKILLQEAEVARINFERFYKENTDTTEINNMGGPKLEGADYTLDAPDNIAADDRDPATKGDAFLQGITRAFTSVPINQAYTIYQSVLDKIIRREPETDHDDIVTQKQEEIELQQEMDGNNPAEESSLSNTSDNLAVPKNVPVHTTNTQGRLFSFGTNPSFSNGNGFGNGSMQEILSRANSGDSRAIMAVLDNLPRSVKDDPRAIAMFKNFLSQLDLSGLTGWNVEIGFDDTNITRGMTDYSTKTISILINTQDTSVMNPSPATVYMHEVMHAILNYAFEERKNNPKMNAVIEQMRAIQEEAAKIIKWQDFLNDPQNATDKEKQDAKDQWGYVFNNQGQFSQNGTNNDDGLKEFLSYATTDATFIRILSQHKIPGTKVSLMTRVKNLMHILLNLITLRSNLSDLAQQGDWLNNTGLNNLAGKDMFTAMQQLAKDIQAANADAEFHYGLINHAAYSFYGMVNKLRTLGNNYLTPFTRNMFSWSLLQKVDFYDPSMSTVKRLSLILASLPFSPVARQAWYDFISRTTRKYHQTDIRLLLDDFGSLDNQREILDTYARNSRAVEAHYQQVKDLVVQSLRAGFGRDLTQEEYDALTDVVMSTDLQCLFDGNKPNAKEIKKLLTNSKWRQQLISALITDDLQLNDIELTDYKTGVVTKQPIKLSDISKRRLQKGIDEISSRWAYAMYYGKGDNFIGSTDDINSLTARIRYTVIYGIIDHEYGKIDDGLKEAIADEMLKAVAERINKAATAKAIEVIAKKNPKMLATVANLEDKGLEVFTQEHQAYVRNIAKQTSALEQEKERGKGFTSSKYNQTLEYVIAPISERDKMEYNGFVLIDNIHDKKNIYTQQGTHLVTKNGVAMGIFVKRTQVLEKRSNSAFTFIATKWAAKDLNSYLADGVSLDQMLAKQVEAYADSLIQQGKLSPDEREGFIEQKTKENLEAQAFAVLKKYRDNKMFDAFNLNKPTSEAQMEKDILETAFDGNSYHPLTRQESVEKLKLSRNSFDILSRMVATQTCFNQSEAQNGALVKLLNNFAQTNRNPRTNRDIKTGQKYVDISERLANELHISKAILAGGAYINGQKLPAIWVREDFVERLFGVMSTNLSQSKIKHGAREGYSKYRPFVRGAFEIIEMILKVLAYKDKETIVMRKPAVIIGNVMSNLSYNTLSEPNLKKVIDMNIANVRNTNNYLQAQRKYEELAHKKRIQNDMLSREDEAEMTRMKNRMDNNPIAPLFESGMFTSIVEDVPLKDREAIQDYFDNFTKNKVVQSIPKPIKTLFNQLYMRPGTPIFDAFYNINRYSDFVARATEYQIQMEKHKDELMKNPMRRGAIEQDVLHDVWNAFIDYDRPNGTVEQYLNDIGLLMFTKYAKGIQRVIVKQMTTNPMGLLIHLAREFALPVAIPDIYEHNVFNKKWSMLFHNPIMNAIDIAIPPLPRLILGLL